MGRVTAIARPAAAGGARAGRCSFCSGRVCLMTIRGITDFEEDRSRTRLPSRWVEHRGAAVWHDAAR
jgi:hypothetical protein